MEHISKDAILESLKLGVSELLANRQYFNDLDTPIGDSDHGDSIYATFSVVAKTIDEFNFEDDLGKLFDSVGKAIIFSGGAAMGPLYGTAFMDSSKAIEGKHQLNKEDFLNLWSAFKGGIERRGKVKVGEKTMFDTISPFVDAIKESVDSNDDFEVLVQKSVEAAKEGMEGTKDMESHRGRSSRLGKRSIGHLDPGSASMFLLLKTFMENIIKK
jgi:dihydroxyacetone kinase-like protein